LYAIGFGGTNAHAVFGEHAPQAEPSTIPLSAPTRREQAKLSIVGMASHFVALHNLTELASAVFDG
jgi:acyl transferase domain-containing protein